MQIQKTQHKTSDLFICFTSMRLSSKSILTHNGSIRKGAQSPAMFPINSKKLKGKSTFTDTNNNNNNHEPSSPKVTCIGQVRVKTKKQGKKMKMLAFRKIQNGSRNQSQKWVHLPFTICESLKGFGCDFSCLIPCKSSCFSSNGKNNDGKNNDGKRSENGRNGRNSCGGVFSWMVSFQEGEGKKDIELVVGGVNEGRVIERVCSRRRSIFDDVEFDDLFNNSTSRDDNGSSSVLVKDNGIRDDNESGSGEVGYNVVRNGNGSVSSGVGCNGIRDDNGLGLVRVNDNVIRVFRDDNGLGLGRGNDNVIRDDNGSGSGGEECGRISICVPPKNALLLMRCRSDPTKMASLSQKFWDPPLVQQVDEGDFRVDHEDNLVIKEVNHGEIEGLVVNEEKIEEIKEDCVKLVDEDKKIDEICDDLGVIEVNVEDLPLKNEDFEVKLEGEKQEKDENSVQEEVLLQNVDETQLIEGVNVGEEGDSRDLEKVLENEVMEVQEKGELEESCVISSNHNSSEESKEELEPNLEKEEKVEKVMVQGEARKSIEKENKNKSMLPDCLLLMMCEPKLSMEVSKETWVCSNDFLRCLPERNKNKKGSKTECGDDQISSSNKKTKAAAVAAHPPLPPAPRGGRSGIQPGRSSISFPTGGGSVANLIEEKLAKAGVGYEPLALTRCKSAPLRSTAKFVPPELACSVWGRGNGPKLEPHRPATCGVGAAAGVGA